MFFFHVPGCSGMFRNVPCSWFYRRPSRNANDPFRQQEGVAVNYANVSYFTQNLFKFNVRLKRKLNYPSQFLHMFYYNV